MNTGRDGGPRCRLLCCTSADELVLDLIELQECGFVEIIDAKVVKVVDVVDVVELVELDRGVWHDGSHVREQMMLEL